VGGVNFNPATDTLKGLLSLLFITSTLTACNDADEAIPSQAGNKLNITVGLNTPQSRAGIITGNTLAVGSTIGILLDDGAETDYDAVNNIKFTASTQDAKQVWTPASDIVLSDTKGTLYAYHPYAQGTDLSAIPVETATQTDYLYATPVQNVNESNASVAVTMNHMLSNIKVSIARGTYVGTGNITKISVESDGFATGGTFNAAQEIPAFSSVTGTGDEIFRNVTTTLGGTATDIMVVPTGTSKAVTFTATIDDVDYTVTSTDVELEEGNSYEYTLSLNSTFMSVASVAVNPWTSVPKGNLTLEKAPLKINTTGKTNGVYAVTGTGELIDYNTADNTCIGVALIVNDAPTPQRFMIAEADANDGINSTLYWCNNITDLSVTNYSKTDGNNSSGYLPKSDYTYGGSGHLSEYYPNWTSGALSDFNGKSNTEIIANSSSNNRDMCKVLSTYNANNNFSDWYVPALGQLALIYLNKTKINEALNKIGRTTIAAENYWASSENTTDYGWSMTFSGNREGFVGCSTKNYTNICVRFIRNI